MNERKLSYKEAVREAFQEEFTRNHSLILIGEDILEPTGGDSVLGDFGKKFSGRIVNRLPLAEEMLGGIALGLYKGGLKPVVQINYSGFIPLVMNDIYQLGIWRYRTNKRDGPGITIRVGHKGYEPHAGAEMSVSLLSCLLHIPNIWVATPSIPYYAKGLLKTALRLNRPAIFFESAYLYEAKGMVPDGEYTVEFGASIVLKPGKNVTIITWSSPSQLTLAAAGKLADKGIDAEVISLETLHPLDIKTILASAKKTMRVLIVEEEMLRGGVGGEIAAQIIKKVPECRIERLAAKNVPVPPKPFHSLFLPKEEDIISAAQDFFKTTRRAFFFFKRKP